MIINIKYYRIKYNILEECHEFARDKGGLREKVGLIQRQQARQKVEY